MAENSKKPGGECTHLAISKKCGCSLTVVHPHSPILLLLIVQNVRNLFMSYSVHYPEIKTGQK